MSLGQEQEIWQKLTRYCAYQERAESEVIAKLNKLNQQQSANAWIQRLRDENYVNETRFALEFARGKFKLQGWGKMKIRMHLKQKKVAEAHIEQALDALDPEDYLAKAAALARQKLSALSGEQGFVRVQKVSRYLYGRGFEAEVVAEAVAHARDGE